MPDRALPQAARDQSARVAAILRSSQRPGDVVTLTAAVRDLHAAHPGQFATDVRTSADGLWLHNPHITRLEERNPDVRVLEMHYPLIHQSNQRPYHFIHGYAQHLEQQLGVPVPVTRFYGDVHLDEQEKHSPPPGIECGVPERFWIIVAGGRHDFTARCRRVPPGSREHGYRQPARLISWSTSLPLSTTSSTAFKKAGIDFCSSFFNLL